MTSAVKANEPAHRLDWLRSPWALVAVLALAVVLRGTGATHWSLWEDEETSIYFSQQPDKPFPRFFPVFFMALHELYQITGVSVAAGRVFAAAVGVLGIALVYAMARRFVSPAVGLLAALLLTLNLGHLFWSQSIRYFGLLFVFQLLSAYWFLLGFEGGRYRYLVLSNLAFALALFTHFSALLLMPVYVAYLFFMVCARQRGGAYDLRGYLTFGLLHGLILGLMAAQFLRFHGVLQAMAAESAQNPVHVFATCLAYFGPVLIVLALLAPLVAVGVPGRIALFFLTAGVLPVLELLVIAGLKLSNVSWYYGFFAVAGFSVAAAITLVSWYQSGRRWTAGLGFAAALLYMLPLLAGYYTTMHGDRPRWRDAADYLRSAAAISPDRDDNPAIFATVPGVVSHYLGVPPGETMGHPLVRDLPGKPSLNPPSGEQWYVVEGKVLSDDYQTWLNQYCELKARFEARTGSVDRTLSVYHYAGSETAQGVRLPTQPDQEDTRGERLR
jgi:hypothetical protein